ncbi:hypothetical protein I2I05_09495 [Hymenobacter sp. BT683]|uniref:DUF3352 domain-containing protein n=1 Tax=Hymenobacter jeongseonensis TaxID=2791027 RepID=A0ABS0IHH4_9BACT|nr:hypothetical protein [Hymenobacter jeongseonensis]MBF9237627.1 hypothetical protein [Hymenobacter jeongseonensis]
MSRKLLALFTALLLLLALATYVYYRRTLAAVPVDPYALVPNDAVLVLSTQDHPTLVRRLQETGLWDNLTAVRYFQQSAGHLALADSLTGGTSRRRTGLLGLLGRKLVITSIHVTGPAVFDVLYQIPLTRVSEYRQVRSLLETLGRDPRYRLTTRDYEDHEFSVLTERSSETSLTVLNYRNHLLISTNPGLVEAVVRRVAHPDEPTVLTPFGATDLLRVRGMDATLMVNYRRLPQFLDVLFRPEAHGQFDHLAGLVSEGLLGMKVIGSRVQLQGFSNPETAKGALQQRLRGQRALPLGLTPMMSMRTALLLHLAANPARTWPRPAGARADSLGNGAALDSLRATFGGEMAIAYLAAPAASSRLGRLAFVHCPTPARTQRWLALLRRLNNNSPSFTNVGPYQVHPVGFAEEAVLGPLLNPAQPNAVEARPGASVVVGNYLVLSDQLTLNGYLADVVAGRTWSQNPSQVAFLQETLPRARLSILVDTRNSWNALLGVLTEERRAGLLRNEALFKRFPQMAMQLVPADNESVPDAQYFTQLLLRHPDLGPATAHPGVAAANGRVLTFKHPLTGMPTLLPALGTRIPAVVVQDSVRALHYVSADNSVLWSDTLAGPAVGVQLLPGGGGVPGGLLAGAGNRLHLMGNEGAEILPFPLHLPDTVRATALLAGPGPAAPARLLVVTSSNELLLLDAKGRLFSGWQPKRLDFPLAGLPAVFSVNSRDVVFVPLQNGYVYAYDQQGNLFPGFPLSMGARLAGGVLVQPGATLSRTQLKMVNQHGELITFSLSGDIISRKRVATWSRTARFQLVPAQRANTCVVIREDGNQLDVYLPNQPGPLVTQRFVTSGPKPVQFFDFGKGRLLVAITEPGPGQVFLYDAKGRLLGGAPVPSTGSGVGLSYDATSDSYQLVRIVGRELRRTELKVGLP